MTKKPMKSKKMSFGKKALIVGVIGGALIGGLAWAGAFTSEDRVVENTQIISKGETAGVTIDVFNSLETGYQDTASEIYVYNAESGVDALMTSGVEKDLTIGASYTAFVMSTGEAGSNANLVSDIKGIIADGTGYKFTVLPTGNSFDLEVAMIGDYSIKAEDSSEDLPLFVGTESGYLSTDALTFDSDNAGAVIPVIDGFEFTVTTRFTDASNTVAMDNGMLIVVDLDDDELEDASVTFNGKTLSKVDVSTLSEADADYFEKKDVFLYEGDDIGKNSELIVAGTLVEDATITNDVKVDIYSRGYDKPASGTPELTTLNADGSALYEHNHKQLTFNLA